MLLHSLMYIVLIIAWWLITDDQGRLLDGGNRIGGGAIILLASGFIGLCIYFIIRWYTKKLYNAQYLESLLR